MTTMRLLDLDAARREQGEPDGIDVRLRGESFVLPAELPADIFDPFLAEEFDLVGLIRKVVAEKDKGIPSAVVSALFDRPTLPLETLNAIHGAFGLLFGDEHYARFKATRPSFRDYGALLTGLFDLYGASLGEAFASLVSSESDGATQKQTSDSTTDSTPDLSGDAGAQSLAS